MVLIVAAIACLATVALATTTKTTVAPAPKAPPKAVTFTGTSDKGDFEEALNAAVQSAIDSRQGHPDAMIEWKLKSVSGVNGGIAGFRKLTVSIEAKPR
jgi:ABC-type glycerol-3-phosphate transport system substrate-binding protein